MNDGRKPIDFNKLWSEIQRYPYCRECRANKNKKEVK